MIGSAWWAALRRNRDRQAILASWQGSSKIECVQQRASSGPSHGMGGDTNKHETLKPRPRTKPFEKVRHVIAKLAHLVLEERGRIEQTAGTGIEMAHSDLKLARCKSAREVRAPSGVLLTNPPQSHWALETDLCPAHHRS